MACHNFLKGTWEFVLLKVFDLGLICFCCLEAFLNCLVWFAVGREQLFILICFTESEEGIKRNQGFIFAFSVLKSWNMREVSLLCHI